MEEPEAVAPTKKLLLALPSAAEENADAQESERSPLSECFFKTRSNGLKMYDLVLTKTHLIFNRPDSRKQA